MSSILLSIKPEYADKILDETKKYEFRRQLARDDVNRIIIYSTSPVMKVIGEVEVVGTLSMKTTLLWKETRKKAGISLLNFRKYFSGCDVANAYVLGKAYRYPEPQPLSKYNIKQAPQSFVYINDTIETKKKEAFDLFSIFDDQFVIENFQHQIKQDESASISVLEATKQAVQEAFGKEEENFIYVVKMTDEMKDKIESGEIKLVMGKDGSTYAQLRGEKGKFSKPLAIDKQLEERGISPAEIQFALQMEAISNQLSSMMESLNAIENKVSEVIQGQHNDRVGLFYSGLSLYAESREIADEYLKRQMQAQALKALSDANAQVIQEARTNIEFLSSEKYKKNKKIMDSINERLESLQQCCCIIYRAALVKAAIYYENNEVSAMLTSMEEYSRFLERLIVPYIGLLSELDKNTKFITKGSWGQMANTLSECKGLREKIKNKEVYYLDMEVTEDADR